MVSGVFSIPLEVPHVANKPASSNGHGVNSPLREYIGGEENMLARVAAQTLLAGPEKFNPLVLFGPTGVGKTHLALGLVERWKHAHRDRKAIVTTGADFARAYAEEVETDSLAEMRDKHLAADLLLIDDVQELAGKRAAQQELQYLLDILVAEGRRVVITARQAPGEIAQFSEALASRLAAGLCVPLAAPGTLARRAILANLAALHEAPLAGPALDLLTERLAGTAPTLNHVIVELQHASRRGKREIDCAAVHEFLAEQSADQRPTLRAITSVVARYFKLKTADLKGPSRRTGVVEARSLAMYLARRLTDESLEQVGQHFGGRDHTTVLHACRKTESLVETDDDTKHMIEELIEQIGSVVVS